MLLELAQLAMAQKIGMTVDAEEADRLELSLEVIARRVPPSLAGRLERLRAGDAGLPEALPAGDRLARRAGASLRPPLVRAPGQGRLLGLRGQARPGRGPSRLPGVDAQAEHRRLLPRLRAPTVPAWRPVLSAVRHAQRAHHRCRASFRERASVRVPAPARHGRRPVRRSDRRGQPRHVPCRVYAPVGSHEDLLPYLVRRLLENGANTSFVNRIVDESQAITDIIKDPAEVVSAFHSIQHPRIDTPANLFGDQRKNSMGINLANDNDLRQLAEQMNAAAGPWSRRAAGARLPITAAPLAGDQPGRSPPADRHLDAGRCAGRGAGAGQRRSRASRLGRDARCGARQDHGTRRRSARSAPRRVHGTRRARSRQDPARRDRRGARGGRFLPLLRGAGAHA